MTNSSGIENQPSAHSTTAMTKHDHRPYEAWLRSVHDMLPGAEGDINRPIGLIEDEVLERLYPLPYHDCDTGAHPRCVVKPERYATTSPAAQLAYALTCAAWNLNSTTAPKDQNARIYDGTDGEGTCWAIGVIGQGEHRRTVFEFYDPLHTLSCRNRSDLIGLWDYMVHTVSETLPETQIKIRYNVDLGEPDLEDLAQRTRVLADLDHVAHENGLTVESWREPGYLETTVHGPEHRTMKTLRELREQHGHEEGFTVDVSYGDEEEEPLYGPLERIWAAYGPKSHGGEGLISDIEADEL